MTISSHGLEEWREIPSLPNYFASSLGRIKSVRYEVEMPRGGKRWYETKAKLGCVVKKTHRYSIRVITLRGKTYKVHRLVAEAFHGLCPKGLLVSHKNEDALDNRPENLEYATNRENQMMPKLRASLGYD